MQEPAKKRPRGRPVGSTKPPEERLTKTITLHVSAEDEAVYKGLGRSLGPEILRQAIRNAAKKARI
jgi:hypothetical protein